MKRIAMLVACLTVTLGAFAQDWQVGVKGGVNFSNLSHAPGDDKMKTSFYAGMFFEYRFSEYFGLQPEVVYSRQGNYYKEHGVKQYNRINYLNIPVMAKIYVARGLSVDIGPQLGIKLNSNTKLKDGNSSVVNDDWNGGYTALDFGIGMGLTYTIVDHWDISARYNLGLTDVRKHNDGDAVRNGVIQLGVGYRF